MAEHEAPVVEIKDLVAGYLPGVNILEGCNLTAGKGELIGIIGPNGAGKSTLLKAMFGQVNVRGGSITLLGEDITGLKANKLRGAWRGNGPPEQQRVPSLTIEENLEMGVYQDPSKLEEGMTTVTELFAELKPRLKQRAGSLSGGGTSNGGYGSCSHDEPVSVAPR